jgi:hypothetical protein
MKIDALIAKNRSCYSVHGSIHLAAKVLGLLVPFLPASAASNRIKRESKLRAGAHSRGRNKLHCMRVHEVGQPQALDARDVRGY